MGTYLLAIADDDEINLIGWTELIQIIWDSVRVVDVEEASLWAPK